jgi:hypothetical protein
LNALELILPDNCIEIHGTTTRACKLLVRHLGVVAHNISKQISRQAFPLWPNRLLIDNGVSCRCSQLAQPISKRGICILGSSERRSSGARENQRGEICARRGEACPESVRALIWTRPAQMRRPQDELESGRRRELLALLDSASGLRYITPYAHNTLRIT